YGARRGECQTTGPPRWSVRDDEPPTGVGDGAASERQLRRTQRRQTQPSRPGFGRLGAFNPVRARAARSQDLGPQAAASSAPTSSSASAETVAWCWAASIRLCDEGLVVNLMKSWTSR